MSDDIRETDLAATIMAGERAGYDTREHLSHARKQAEERGLDKIFIADVDAHHYERESWWDIVKYIEDPVLRERAMVPTRQGGAQELFAGGTSNQDVAGRIVRYPRRHREPIDEGDNRELTLIRREMHAIGIDVQVIFPTPMLQLGLHPDPWMEVQLSWAYSRWFTEEILPHDRAIRTMVYLPLNTPEVCLRHIEAFADKPGVAGFMVTAPRFQPVHADVFMPIYAAIQDAGKALAFHGGFNGRERMFEGMNRFLSVHALGFVMSNMVHLTNMVINGIPERFPKMPIIMIESGLAWIPFMMQRLDRSYMSRSSEAPLLTKKPSDYLRENFYYSSQPIEDGDQEALEFTMNMINAETQLMYSSDYPHWDFDLPSTIYDLPFLSEAQKLAILGGNAKRVLNIDKV